MNENPLSFDHWANSLGLATTAYIGYKMATAPAANPYNLTADGKVTTPSSAGKPASGGGNKSVESTRKSTDFYVTPQGDAIPGTKAGFNNNLSMMEIKNEKYVGSSSNGPVRIRVEGMHTQTDVAAYLKNPYHEVPHIHVEYKQNIFSGPWGKGLGNNHTLPQDWLK